MILNGSYQEMQQLFNSNIAIRYYEQIGQNLFKLCTRSTVPNTIKTLSELSAYYEENQSKTN